MSTSILVSGFIKDLQKIVFSENKGVDRENLEKKIETLFEEFDKDVKTFDYQEKYYDKIISEATQHKNVYINNLDSIIEKLKNISPPTHGFKG